MLLETKVDVATIFIVGSDKKASQIEFGAHQVILVRNQAAKELLPQEFNGCLVMTVLESKGLEFDDVFLWNFFADSKASKEWRLVLSYLTENNEAEIEALKAAEHVSSRNSKVAGMLRTLNFDPHVHQILCEELKHLYTAITRARVKVVIYDQDEEKRAPMFHFLQRKELVQVISVLNQQGVCTSLAAQTKPEEWRSRGMNLRDTGMFQLAAMCFKNSGDEALEMEAHGEALAKQAITLKSKERQECFFNAGEMFFKAEKLEKACRCFYESADYELAGGLFMRCSVVSKNEADAEQLAKYAVACYQRAGKIKEAVQILVQHKKIKRALKILKDEREYETALSVLENNPTFVAPADLSLHTFAALAAVHHPAIKGLRNGTADTQLTQEYLALLKRLPDEDEILQLRKFPILRKELVSRLVSSNRHAEAASILEEQGDILSGATLLVERPSPAKSEVLLAIDLYILHAVTAQNGKDSQESLRCFQEANKWLERLLSASDTKAIAGSEQQAYSLQILQLELQTAQRVPDGLKREKALRKVISTSQQLGCKLAEALAMHQIITHKSYLSRRRDHQSRRKAVAEIHRSFTVLCEVLKRLGERLATSQHALMAERFFGAARQGTLLSMRRGSKALLDSYICGLRSIGNKDGMETVKLEVFHTVLKSNLMERRLDLLQALTETVSSACLQHTKLQHNSGTGQELSEALLRVWATVAGARLLRECGQRLECGARVDSWKSAFSKRACSDACNRVAALICDHGDEMQALPNTVVWKGEQEEAVCAMVTHVKELCRDGCCGIMADLNLLYRGYKILRGIGALTDAQQLLLEASRRLQSCQSEKAVSALTNVASPSVFTVSDATAQPPLVSEIDAAAIDIENAARKRLADCIDLLMLSSSASDNGNHLEQAHYMLKYHSKTADCNRDGASEGWASATLAVAEALFELSVAGASSYMAAVRRPANARAASLVLPEPIARKLITFAQRRRVMQGQAELAIDVLKAAFDYLLLLLSSMAKSGENTTRAAARLAVTLWVAVANFLITVDSGERSGGLATCRWPLRAVLLLQESGRKVLEAAVSVSCQNTHPGTASILSIVQARDNGITQTKDLLRPLLDGHTAVVASLKQLCSSAQGLNPNHRLVLVSVTRELAAPGTRPIGAEFVLSQLVLDQAEMENLEQATERGLNWVRTQNIPVNVAADPAPSSSQHQHVVMAGAIATITSSFTVDNAANEVKARMEKEDAHRRRSVLRICRFFQRLRNNNLKRSKIFPGNRPDLLPVATKAGDIPGDNQKLSAMSINCDERTWREVGQDPPLWDPFGRYGRYSMFVVTKQTLCQIHPAATQHLQASLYSETELWAGESDELCWSVEGHGKTLTEELWGLWDQNCGELLVDGSDMHRLEAVILNLERFKVIYIEAIAPALICLDRVYFALKTASQRQCCGELTLSPEDTLTLDSLLVLVTDVESKLMTALQQCDTALWQPESPKSEAFGKSVEEVGVYQDLEAIYPPLSALVKEIYGHLPGAVTFVCRLQAVWEEQIDSSKYISQFASEDVVADFSSDHERHLPASEQTASENNVNNAQDLPIMLSNVDENGHSFSACALSGSHVSGFNNVSSHTQQIQQQHFEPFVFGQDQSMTLPSHSIQMDCFVPAQITSSDLIRRSGVNLQAVSEQAEESLSNGYTHNLAPYAGLTPNLPSHFSGFNRNPLWVPPSEGCAAPLLLEGKSMIDTRPAQFSLPQVSNHRESADLGNCFSYAAPAHNINSTTLWYGDGKQDRCSVADQDNYRSFETSSWATKLQPPAHLLVHNSSLFSCMSAEEWAPVQGAMMASPAAWNVPLWNPEAHLYEQHLLWQQSQSSCPQQTYQAQILQSESRMTDVCQGILHWGIGGGDSRGYQNCGGLKGGKVRQRPGSISHEHNVIVQGAVNKSGKQGPKGNLAPAFSTETGSKGAPHAAAQHCMAQEQGPGWKQEYLGEQHRRRRHGPNAPKERGPTLTTKINATDSVASRPAGSAMQRLGAKHTKGSDLSNSHQVLSRHTNRP